MNLYDIGTNKQNNNNNKQKTNKNNQVVVTWTLRLSLDMGD